MSPAHPKINGDLDAKACELLAVAVAHRNVLDIKNHQWRTIKGTDSGQFFLILSFLIGQIDLVSSSDYLTAIWWLWHAVHCCLVLVVIRPTSTIPIVSSSLGLASLVCLLSTIWIGIWLGWSGDRSACYYHILNGGRLHRLSNVLLAILASIIASRSVPVPIVDVVLLLGRLVLWPVWRGVVLCCGRRVLLSQLVEDYRLAHVVLDVNADQIV